MNCLKTKRPEEKNGAILSSKFRVVIMLSTRRPLLLLDCKRDFLFKIVVRDFYNLKVWTADFISKAKAKAFWFMTITDIIPQKSVRLCKASEKNFRRSVW